jgi:hypothetical protein
MKFMLVIIKTKKQIFSHIECSLLTIKKLNPSNEEFLNTISKSKFSLIIIITLDSLTGSSSVSLSMAVQTVVCRCGCTVSSIFLGFKIIVTCLLPKASAVGIEIWDFKKQNKKRIKNTIELK